MSTIITYPDALSLSRNLKKFLISSGVPVTFTLKKENQEILSEVYSPTPAGTIEIDIEDAVNDQLSLVLPISDVFTQPGTAADFSAIVDGVTKSFRVVKGGVCGLSITAVEFLKSNFLSWQPQTKSVTGTQPEWICYYAPEAAKIRCRFYNNNGTQAVTDLATLAAGECKSINVQFNRIINLNATKKLAYFDVWVENNSGVRLSYVQRYILIPGTNTERFFLFENSLGGIDCLSCTGEEVISPDSEFTLAEMDDETIQSAKRFEKWILQSTGFKNNIEALWIQDFFRSGQRYVVDSGTVKKIVLQESTIEINSRDAVNEFTFKYRSATDKGLLSLSRSLETPAGIEFPTAEQLFFLAPRLNEFLEADINESLLIPVQSPYQTVWKRLSVGALLSFLKAYADKFRHQHGNFPLLEKFSISLAGNLLFNGKEIAGDGGDVDLSDYYTKTTSDGRFAKLAGDIGQDFSSKKFVSKTFIIPATAPEGLATGESAFYRRHTGFGGATPGVGSGLDPAALWVEMATNDSTKKVHLSHIPTIPYSSLSGRPSIPNVSTWALAATKPTYGVSEITGLQEALDNVSVDLSNYYTKTTSDGRFAKLAGDLTQNFSAKKFLSKIFIIPSAVPEGLASGESAFYRRATGFGGANPGVGGLDRDAMWSELATNNTTKKIHNSHLNVPAWALAVSKPGYSYLEVGAAAASHEHSQYALSSSLSDYLPITRLDYLMEYEGFNGLIPSNVNPGKRNFGYINGYGSYVSYGSSNYHAMLYSPYGGNSLQFRNKVNGVWDSYKTVFHSGNSNLLTFDWRCRDLIMNNFIRSNSIISLFDLGSAAQGLNIKDLLVSNVYSDRSLVPSYGIYSKGIIMTDGGIRSTNILISNLGNTIRIGSQNTGLIHIMSSGVPFYFNKNLMILGDVFGGSSYNRRLAYVDEIAGIKVNNSILADNALAVGNTPFQSICQQAHYSTFASENTGYYKITMPEGASWMVSLTIRVYQKYEAYDILVCGYNYGASYWYLPKAVMLGSTKEKIEVTFGHDGLNNLWIGIPAKQYTGLTVLGFNNGYSQLSQWANNVTITRMPALTGTVQSRVTAYSPLYLNGGNLYGGLKISGNMEAAGLVIPVGPPSNPEAGRNYIYRRNV